MFNNFYVENRDLYEIIWKNAADSDRPQMIIGRMRIAR